jgi:TonB family protein
LKPQQRTQSVPRSALFLLIIGSMSVSALEARMATSPPPGTPICQVTETNDDSAQTSEFAFSGRVHNGEVYECEFVRGFVFQLRPTVGGWEIVVHDPKRDDNLARLTPSVNGKSPLLITGLDFRNESSPSPNDVKKPRDERQFSFSPVPARGNGWLSIADIQFDDRQPETAPVIADLSFDVKVQLDALRGIPIYAAGSGVTPPRVTYSPDPQYSKEARKAHLRGTVRLAVVVGPDGRPMNIKVTQALGKGLDEKAIEAVSNWKFEPGTKGGVPVPVRISIQCEFRYPGF